MHYIQSAMTATSEQWILFHVLVVSLLTFDLFFYHRESDVIPLGSALKMSAFWIFLALLFNFYIFWTAGSQAGVLFLTGYLVEKSLSVDNLFVFLFIFQRFEIKPKHQHRILFFGILGALVMRALFIFGGIALIHYFESLIYLLGIFLFYSGIKLLKETMTSSEQDQPHLSQEPHPWVDWIGSKLTQLCHASDGLEKGEESDARAAFWLRDDRGGLRPTKFFVALVVIELSDVIFALDSIPAILAITSDPFIVYTSNICAILGLRALYFALQGLVNIFEYLSHGIALILVFVGSKMALKPLFVVPPMLSLAVIASILAASILYSVRRRVSREGNK